MRKVHEKVVNTVENVEFLITKRIERAQASRRTSNCEKLRAFKLLEKVFELAGNRGARCEIAEKIVDLGNARDGLFFHIGRGGQSHEQGITWLPVCDL